jgi:hypothetical protein
MLRKLILTETEKKQISHLHYLINEDENTATIEGYSKFRKDIVPNVLIELLKNNETVQKTTSDENGYYKFVNIPLGSYVLKFIDKDKKYLEQSQSIEINSKGTFKRDLQFTGVQEEKEVVTTSGKNTIKTTLVDVNIVDSDGEPIGPCKIQIFDSEKNKIDLLVSKTNDDGVLKNIILDGEKNPELQIIPGTTKLCKTKTKITVKATFGNTSNQKEFDICLWNGNIKIIDDVQTISRIKIKTEDTDIDLTNTNILNIDIPASLNYEVSVIDSENKDVLNKSNVLLYSDKDKTTLINKGTPPLSGTLDREKLERGGYENAFNIYYVASNNEYDTKEGKLTLSKRKENKFNIGLTKTYIAPPKPVEPPSERECIRLTMKHYRNMENVDAGNITISELGGVAEIKKNAEVVKACYVKYMKEYPRRMEKTINRLKNVQSELDFFKLRFTNQEIRSIYGESRTMLLKNTIRKVVSESVENKSEKILIEERLKFSITGLNKKNSSEVKRALRNERYNLINFGYNKELIRESFLDVMKGLYGNDETNVLTDIKTRLGQRIADQVKNKQEEHEMILSAFNELSEEMIERAIKENRVDELSTEIATKALEIYKTQFGTEGLSGIMIASVDENKFKQEVAKLIEPAIKEITTKMDEKLKQVQDVVSGGINPTA